MGKYDLISIIGPTACGKTALAVAVARDVGGEILSADSRQVYRGMDIGTGKDISEYGNGDSRVPYHLILMTALRELGRNPNGMRECRLSYG